MSSISCFKILFVSYYEGFMGLIDSKKLELENLVTSVVVIEIVDLPFAGLGIHSSVFQANHSFFCEQPERIAHGPSFVKSNRSDLLTVALL